MDTQEIIKTPVDRFLEILRFAKAKPYIPKGVRLLDIGTGDGTFLRSLDGHLGFGIGIDPLLTTTVERMSYRLIPGVFPRDFVTSQTFDVITLLAVIEHLPASELQKVADACWNYLIPGGRVLITVPHPCVDRILAGLKFFRILHGLSLEEHHGFNPKEIPEIFNHWTLLKEERWELGFNYFFIFEKPEV